MTSTIISRGVAGKARVWHVTVWAPMRGHDTASAFAACDGLIMKLSYKIAHDYAVWLGQCVHICAD